MYIATTIGIILVSFYAGIFFAIWRAHRRSKLREYMKGGPGLSFGQIINEPEQQKVTEFSHENPQFTVFKDSGITIFKNE